MATYLHPVWHVAIPNGNRVLVLELKIVQRKLPRILKVAMMRSKRMDDADLHRAALIEKPRSIH